MTQVHANLSNLCFSSGDIKIFKDGTPLRDYDRQPTFSLSLAKVILCLLKDKDKARNITDIPANLNPNPNPHPYHSKGPKDRVHQF